MNTVMNIQSIREQFPVLAREINGYPLAYLDNAASAQKPGAVLEAMKESVLGKVSGWLRA